MNEIGLYELSFTYRFEAAHRFTGTCSQTCATPHGHTWYAKALFEAAENSLSQENDMVMEFARLKTNWKRFIQETVDHSFLHHHLDPILPALRDYIPGFRGLPFPGDPTTELIAALFYSKLKVMHEALPGCSHVRPVGVIIRETPTNQMIFRAPSAGNSQLLERINSQFKGWWQDPDPAARDLTAQY